MLGAALRSSGARAGRAAARQVRYKSENIVAAVQAEAEHAEKEASKWRMISFGCIPVCLGLGIMTMSNQHAHHRHAPDYPYLLIKAKEFPWGPDPLFGVPK